MAVPHPRTDADLVVAARAGSHQAFTDLVERHGAYVSALACALARSPSEGEELAQDTFVVAWWRLGELRRPEQFRHWLSGITRNLYRRSRRDQRRWSSAPAGARGTGSDVASSEPSPLEQTISEEEQRLLAWALARIPENCRVALLLYYREQQPIDRVAEMLGLTVRTVQAQLIRGRKMMQEHLGVVEPLLARAGRRRNLAAAVLAAIVPGIPAPGEAALRRDPTARVGARAGRLVARVALIVLPLAAAGVFLVQRSHAPSSGPARKMAVASLAPPGVPLPWGARLPVAALGPVTNDPEEPAGGIRGQVIFSFDFEDGVLPDMFTDGTIADGPPRPGNRNALLAGLCIGDPHETLITLFGGESLPFRYAGSVEVSFDYWLGDDARSVDGAKVIAVELAYGHKKVKREMAAVTASWSHASVRLAGFGPVSEAAPLLEPGEPVRKLRIWGGLPGGKPFYVDNIKVVDTRTGE